MKLDEFQSKRLFAEYGVPIPRGEVVTTPEEARRAAGELGGPVVVKAQVLAGGRGKAGGIKLARSPEEAEAAAAAILGMEIKGLPVRRVLVDQAADVQKEIYLGVVVDRAVRRAVVMASGAGGVEIEEVARATPEAIKRVAVDPFLGLQGYQALYLAKGVGLEPDLRRAFGRVANGLYAAFCGSDASLVEINPLVVTGEGDLLAVDGKVVLDDNGLFRHPELAALRDHMEAEEAPVEREAREAGLSYVKLDGSIGCMVNGAGLAMATMDIIQHFDGAPANFLDIGGGAKADRVATALRLILADAGVRAVLLNIFGGITRCDEVAKGVVAALDEIKPQVPVVARLVGTNEEQGRAVLDGSSHRLATAATLAEAARLAVEAARGQDVAG